MYVSLCVIQAILNYLNYDLLTTSYAKATYLLFAERVSCTICLIELKLSTFQPCDGHIVACSCWCQWWLRLARYARH